MARPCKYSLWSFKNRGVPFFEIPRFAGGPNDVIAPPPLQVKNKYSQNTMILVCIDSKFHVV